MTTHRLVPVKNLTAALSLLPPKPVTIEGKGTFVYQDPQAAKRLNELRSVFDALLDASNPFDIASLRRLVFAARKVAFEDRSNEAIKELDVASEAFASTFPWQDEPR